MNPIRILIADDHALVRSGLRALFESRPDLEVVGEAEDGVMAAEQCRKLKPDVAVMDLSMPGRSGISAIEDICRDCTTTKVVVLTMHDDEAYMRIARLAGASGFVLKKALATELINAIRAVHEGKIHFACAELPRPNTPGKSALDLISGREREILTLVALGHTTAEIAEKLHISDKTVETHRAHITEKLDLHSRAELVRFALDHGLLKV